MSAKTERLKTPLLFPCAARVKMPQLGSEDSDLKAGFKSGRFAPDAIVFRTSGQPEEPVSKEYLKKVSTDLRFEEDVVKERCFHALPYDEKYMYEAFDISDLVSLPPTTRIPVGRYDSRGKDIRHMPCNLTKSSKSHLKPLKRRITQRAQQMHLEAMRREELKEQLKREQEILLEQIDERALEEQQDDQQGFFLTETKQEPAKAAKQESKLEAKAEPKTDDAEQLSEKPTSDVSIVEDTRESKSKRNDWDSYLLSLLSSNTANWIVYERTPIGSQDREKLEPLLKKWYGTPDHTDLIRDDMSDTEVEPEKEEKKAPKKKWKKKEATLLQKVYDLEEAEPEAVDPYSDDNKAPFYRQPAGLRRAKKHEEKEELGAINTTAANITVKVFQPPPPPTLRDFINPSVGQFLIETDNMFQQERLTGTDQIHDNFGDKNKIVMESANKYKKNYQPQFPQAPEDWFPETDGEKEIQRRDRKKQKKFQRGHRRWKTLPEPIDPPVRGLPQSMSIDIESDDDDTAELLNVVAPGTESDFSKSADPRTRKTAKNNQSLMQIIDEWRTKWHLTGQYVDSTPDDLIKDMADIQPHVRLKAIATCAKAADYKPPADEGIQLDYLGKEDTVNSLPERLFVALECLLNDAVDKVKKAAAITLYSLKRTSPEAEEVLYEALQSENPVDRWAAAQCLAHFGVCDSEVVGEILKQVMNTEDTIKHERGISMLGILSVTSALVHSMVAEQLNSSSWRHKVIACKILPTLKGDINKDITNKLSDLMWNDWHSEVRRAAAQCLGKTGHGRDVHDDLRKQIMNGDERLKLEAISKVGQLGIMTAKLLPAFLKCFDDEYISVRSEVCITCGNLQIKDEEVISKLISMATFDVIWKVKAHAFQALGKIGLVTEQIVDCLLWAVRYEENPGVRAEACHTLAVLKVKTEEVADVLQERFLVESNHLVREDKSDIDDYDEDSDIENVCLLNDDSELAATLKMFDISATEDMDMVAQIKKEVKKLCTRNIIASQITLNEMDDDRRENLARMIYESEKEMKMEQSESQAKKDEETLLRKLRVNHTHMVVNSNMITFQRKSSVHSFAVNDLRKEQVKEPEPVMERLRTLSRSDSLPRIKEESMPGTPEHRDSVFTPTAEQELDAILNKQDATTTPTTDQTTTPGSKSRPTTASSSLGEESQGDEEESEEEGEESQGEESEHDKAESSETDVDDKHDMKTPSEPEKASEAEADREVAKVTERPTSTVKFAAHLEVTDIPSRTQSSLGPSRLSLMDENGKPSRLSVATTTATEGMVFGRDAIIEREKINEEARNTFAVMDLRYKDMVQDLIELDNAFELGLTDGDRQNFEERIQSVKIVRTPPSNKGRVKSPQEQETDSKGRKIVSETSPDIQLGESIKDTSVEETVEIEGTVIKPLSDDVMIVSKSDIDGESISSQSVIPKERKQMKYVMVGGDRASKNEKETVEEESDDDMDFDTFLGESGEEGEASVTIVVTESEHAVGEVVED